MGGFPSYIHVVASHKGCVFVAVDFTVYQHHGDADVVCLFDNGTKRLPLIGCHDDGIDFSLDEALDVGNLLLGVVGRGVDFHIEVGVKESLT